MQTKTMGEVDTFVGASIKQEEIIRLARELFVSVVPRITELHVMRDPLIYKNTLEGCFNLAKMFVDKAYDYIAERADEKLTTDK